MIIAAVAQSIRNGMEWNDKGRHCSGWTNAAIIVLITIIDVVPL